MGFNYLFIFPSSYVALCGSKAHHRLGSESVWKLLSFLRLPSQDRAPSQEGSLKKRSFQTPGNTLTAESAASLGTTESNITGRKNK